jgi:hypothetical protein
MLEFRDKRSLHEAAWSTAREAKRVSSGGFLATRGVLFGIAGTNQPSRPRVSVDAASPIQQSQSIARVQ